MSTIPIVRLLAVSGDFAVLRPLNSIGESNGWRIEIAANEWEAMDRVQSGVIFDLVLLDLSTGEGEDLHTLRWLRRLRPLLPIVLVGHSRDAGKREESIRIGANDYVFKPIEERSLEMIIQSNLSTRSDVADMDITSDDVEQISDGRFFIGLSPIMRRLRSQVALLAESNVPVLILGEDGSGKETTARLVHRLSVRSAFEFAKVKCKALPGDLLDRELFGYERKGTVTESRIRSGKLEICAKGTILLDEITEMPMDLQSRLVKVLHNGRYIRPGSSTLIELDVRLLATSSTNLELAVSENRLDEALYRLLAEYTIHLPPLRERKNEIPSLAFHFMHQLARRYGMPAREMSSAIIEAWQAYEWPGNLRDLEHCVKRYLMVGDKELVVDRNRMKPEGETPGTAFALSRAGKQVAPPRNSSGPQVSDSKSLRSLIQSVKSEAEKNAISAALEKTGWNRKAAARLLKVSYRTVLYKIEQYKMTSLDASLYRRGNRGGNGNGCGHMVTELPGNDLRG